MSLQDFEYGRVLGKGVFGSVLIVKRKEDNEIYAMKRVKIGGLTKKELENSFNEVRLLASLNHKNVIGYREAFYDQKSKTLNIVMEYADDGDLSTKIKQYIKRHMYFDEKTLWSTLIQILEGLKYLHKSYIIHRDLKSANIFLTKKGEVKIGDLNVSKIIGKSMAITQTGTPYYASPEIWNDHPYDYKCDIWSAGCIIYEMAALKMPFRGTSMQMLYNKVMKGDFDPIPSRYSNELMEIIKLILTKNPHKRPSAEDLLKHRIILEKMEKIGMEKNIWKYEDEKAMLINTIKLPRNINQMNQVNRQLPRKNYKKDRYLNEMEMFENDEFETAKNSFYHKDDKNNRKKKDINNLNNPNTLKNLYIEPNKIKPLMPKKYKENESNITDINSKKNYSINKYNYNYKYNLNYNRDIIRSKSNINNNKNNSKKIIITNNNKNNNFINHYQKEKDIDMLQKLNNFDINKREDFFSPQNIVICQNKKLLIKDPTTESLRISNSNILTSEAEKVCKIQTSVNEPLKLIPNPNINNPINNIYQKSEGKNKYIPISSLNNGTSFINNIFESQINRILDKKSNMPKSISSIQQKNRQRQNKYMPNPSFDNILKNKKIKTLDSQKKKLIQNKYKYNNINITNNNSKKTNSKEILRNRSFKGIIYNSSILKEDNLVEEKIQKKVKKNSVRRNVSTDFLKKKNSYNYNENIYNNNSQLIPNNISISKENLSNNNRVKRIKKQLEDILPPFEFEKIFKNRLPSANNGINRNKSNVNVKININNNYNYINNLNINNNNHKLNLEKQYRLLSKNNRNNPNLNNNPEYFYNNKLPSRPRSTSSIKIKDKVNNKNNFRPPPMIKINNFHKNENKNNLTEINDNNNKEYSNKKYREIFNFYYKIFLNDKLRNSNNNNNYQKNINFNQKNEIGEKINYNKDNRKVTYEKIKILQNQGEERKYIKGPSIIRCVGEGNMNNKCHRAIFKYHNMLKNINDYSIQNLNNKEFKDDKIGPRIILPKKMLIPN